MGQVINSFFDLCRISHLKLDEQVTLTLLLSTQGKTKNSYFIAHYAALEMNIITVSGMIASQFL